jgi:adenylate kinase family enzyme
LKKILIFGNSGSGKTTLAKKLAERQGLSHFDLDSIAWLATKSPQRRPLDESLASINSFCNINQSWVIEGCYADLIEPLCDQATQIIFMDLSTEECVSNAKNRPWEPHKYASKQQQDENIAMLIDWIHGYETRQDTFSKQAHRALYDQFYGLKKIIKSND